MRRGERIPTLSSSYAGRIVLTVKNGCLVADRPLNEDEFIGTLATFLELAERAGYQVIGPVTMPASLPEDIRHE